MTEPRFFKRKLHACGNSSTLQPAVESILNQARPSVDSFDNTRNRPSSIPIPSVPCTNCGHPRRLLFLHQSKMSLALLGCQGDYSLIERSATEILNKTMYSQDVPKNQEEKPVTTYTAKTPPTLLTVTTQLPKSENEPTINAMLSAQASNSSETASSFGQDSPANLHKNSREAQRLPDGKAQQKHL